MKTVWLILILILPLEWSILLPSRKFLSCVIFSEKIASIFHVFVFQKTMVATLFIFPLVLEVKFYHLDKTEKIKGCSKLDDMFTLSISDPKT